jgi:hypothetical protein
MEEQQRSGFWSTLPGILTGSAALITAATGGYLAMDRTKPSPTEASANAKPLGLVGPTPAEAAAPEIHAPVAPEARADPPPAAPPPVAAGTPRPSFNCALASNAVETMVCGDVGLADRDRQVARQYFALRGQLPPDAKSQLLDSQRYFLKRRSACTSNACLAEVYDERLRQLAGFATN